MGYVSHGGDEMFAVVDDGSGVFLSDMVGARLLL